LALGPHIGTVAVHAERKVKIKRGVVIFCLVAQVALLFVALPLDVKMVLISTLVIVIGNESAGAGGGRPMEPNRSFALDFGAKGGVVPRQGMSRHILLKARPALGSFRQKKF